VAAVCAAAGVLLLVLLLMLLSAARRYTSPLPNSSWGNVYIRLKTIVTTFLGVGLFACSCCSFRRRALRVVRVSKDVEFDTRLRLQVPACAITKRHWQPPLCY
jgi:hypothetical protein